jgi:hypothetical protein
MPFPAPEHLLGSTPSNKSATLQGLLLGYFVRPSSSPF